MYNVRSQRQDSPPRPQTMGGELGWRNQTKTMQMAPRGGSVAATNAATSLNGMHSSSNCEIGGVRSPSSLTQHGGMAQHDTA